MSRHVKDLGFGITQHIGLAIGNLNIDAGNAVPVGFRSADDAAGLLSDLQIATGVITMVMGVENLGNLPALGDSSDQHRVDHDRAMAPVTPVAVSCTR